MDKELEVMQEMQRRYVYNRKPFFNINNILKEGLISKRHTFKTNSAKVHIKFSSNNIIATLEKKSHIITASSGDFKINGKQKKYKYALRNVVNHIANICKKHRINFVYLIAKGYYVNYKLITKIFLNKRIYVYTLVNNTSKPHNGCRKSKLRRL